MFKPMLEGYMLVLQLILLLYLKSLNKTETPNFALLFVVCLQVLPLQMLFS